MPPRPKGTITVDTTNAHFGGYVTYAFTWSEPDDPSNFRDPWARLSVYQDGELVQQTYSALRVDASDPLGPTPSWSGGGADAKVELGYWGRRFMVVDGATFVVGI